MWCMGGITIQGLVLMSLPQAKKSLGQHWLTDKPSLQAMVEAANVEAGDVVLEIGPGTGTLTEELLDAGAHVMALEFDTTRAAELARMYAGNEQIEIQEGDVRTFDLGTLPAEYKIVANIPYYLTANLLRKLTDDEHKPSIASLLVQKEVAERVTSEPGDLSQLAVFVQIFYQVHAGELVPAHLFTPPPQVDSQVLVLTKRPKPLIQPNKELLLVVKAGFSERRKKLRSSLSGGLRISKEQAESLLSDADVDPHKRAQELTLEEWDRIATEYESSNT